MTKGSTQKLSIGALLSWEKANLAPFALAIFYLIFPPIWSGSMDQTTMIFGLMFLTITIMRAKGSNYVISGLVQAFIGVSYFSAVAGLIALEALWILSIVCFVIFLVFELTSFHFGPRTNRSDAFQIVPLCILGFTLVMALANYGSIYVIDFANPLSALNYVAVMLFCFVYMFQIAGWNVTGKQKTTNYLILALAIGAIFFAFAGTTQGTLWAWS